MDDSELQYSAKLNIDDARLFKIFRRVLLIDAFRPQEDPRKFRGFQEVLYATLLTRAAVSSKSYLWRAFQQFAFPCYKRTQFKKVK